MKRSRLNLILAAVLVALGVAVYVAQRPKPKAAEPPLTALNSATVRHVAVAVPGHKTITLDKDKSGHWMLTAPVQAPADPDEVNGLLNVATSPCEQSVPHADSALANFGLAPPHYTLTFDKTTVDVGASEPIRYRRYVKTGDHVCLVSNPNSQSVTGDYSSLVSKQLVPRDARIVGVDLPGFSVKQGDGGWQVTPADADAANDAPQKLVDAWAAATASWNTRIGGKNALPADAPVAVVHLKDGRALHFRIAKTKAQLELARDDLGVIFNLSKIDDQTLLQLQKKAAAKPAPKATAATPSSTMPPAGAPARP